MASLRRRVVWLVGIAAAGLGAIAAVRLAVDAQAARRWDELRQRTDALARRIAADPGLRPVLHGEAVEGDGWPHYTAAFAGLSDPRLVAILGRIDAGEVVAIAPDEAAAVLAPLRRGAVSDRAQVPFEPERGFGYPVPSILFPRKVAALAEAAARGALAAGDATEAARVLLDELQFGSDLMHARIPIFASMGYNVVLFGARAARGSLRRLDDGARAVLHEGVVRLARRFEVAPPWLAGQLVLLRYAHDDRSTPSDMYGGAHWTFWRHGFSFELAAAMHGLHIAGLVDELEAAEPSDLAACLRRTTTELARGALGWRFTSWVVPHWLETEADLRRLCEESAPAAPPPSGR